MFASVGDEKEFSGLAVAYINGTGEIFASDWPGMIPETICKQANNTADNPAFHSGHWNATLRGSLKLIQYMSLLGATERT